MLPSRLRFESPKKSWAIWTIATVGPAARKLLRKMVTETRPAM